MPYAPRDPNKWWLADLTIGRQSGLGTGQWGALGNSEYHARQRESMGQHHAPPPPPRSVPVAGPVDPSGWTGVPAAGSAAPISLAWHLLAVVAGGLMGLLVAGGPDSYVLYVLVGAGGGLLATRLLRFIVRFTVMVSVVVFALYVALRLTGSSP